MHVQQALGAGALMQIVDILGDQQELARPLGIEPRKCPVRVIRLDRTELLPPRVVESVHQRRIAAVGLGRAHVFDPVAFPQSIGSAKGRKPAFGRHARAGQNNDVPNVGHAVVYERWGMSATGGKAKLATSQIGRAGHACHRRQSQGAAEATGRPGLCSDLSDLQT